MKVTIGSAPWPVLLSNLPSVMPPQVLTEVYAQRPLPLPEHVGVSLVLHCIVDQRQEVSANLRITQFSV